MRYHKSFLTRAKGNELRVLAEKLHLRRSFRFTKSHRESDARDWIITLTNSRLCERVNETCVETKYFAKIGLKCHQVLILEFSRYRFVALFFSFNDQQVLEQIFYFSTRTVQSSGGRWFRHQPSRSFNSNKLHHLTISSVPRTSSKLNKTHLSKAPALLDTQAGFLSTTSGRYLHSKPHPESSSA